MPMPMFKSCRYCRHRKKKCVLPPPDASDTRCLACQHLDTSCEIGARQPSAKRRLKSQRIASSLSPDGPSGGPAALATAPPHHDLPSESILIRVASGDCQIPRADAGPSTAKAIIVPDPVRDTECLTTAEKYRAIAQHEFPFVPAEFLVNPGFILSQCISIATNLSLRNSCPGLSDAQLCDLITSLNCQRALSPADLAGLLLLLPRIQPNHRLVELTLMNASFTSLSNTPLPMAVGYLTARTWLSIVEFPLPCSPLHWPLSVLADYGQSLDQTTFAPHFLKLTHLAATFVDLRRAEDNDGLSLQGDSCLAGSAVTVPWAQLEYSTLLNVAQMRSEFLDVRDDMPATPAAAVTHMLQSSIFLVIYHHFLCRRPALGRSLGLRPVPGVLHFICAIARSVFICPPRVVDNWPLLADVQATTVRLLLDFWSLTRAENCRALLNLWEPTAERFESLARHVRAQLGEGPWDVEVIDGYSVFWMFRDLRSLSLESLMREDGYKSPVL